MHEEDPRHDRSSTSPHRDSVSNFQKGRTGLSRLFWATRHSLDGLRAAYLGESAFRQEVWLTAALTPVALVLGRNWVEIHFLLGSLLLLLVVELLNSAIEATVDRISLDLHDLSKRAKDMASAAVLLTLLGAVMVWLTIIFRRCFDY